MVDLYLPWSYIPLWPLIYTFGTIFWATFLVLALMAVGGFLIRYIDEHGDQQAKSRLERDMFKLFPQHKMRERLQWLKEQTVVAERALGNANNTGGKAPS
ncbi:hypothetical protein F4803DRAFT_550416 [Xylaria telfairii]|nr:hypothetical protein F4803DRAFT_550416 [Xylaria telfairii]